MRTDTQPATAPVRLWDVLVEIGFTPVTGRLAPSLQFDFGSFTVETMQTMNRNFGEVVLFTGYAIGQRVMAELLQELPCHVESRRHGVALLTWAIERSLGDFLDGRHPVPTWVEEGRRARELLPWEREREAYAQCPHCCIPRDWAKLAIRAIRERLEQVRGPAPLTFFCDGEALFLRCAGKFVAALPATGKPWQHTYLLNPVSPDRLPRWLAPFVTISVWKGSLTFGRAVVGDAVPIPTALSTRMNILFLHGKESKPGGTKPTYLAQHGLAVLNPALPDDDFYEAVRIAQGEFDRHRPDVVIGSSRGGAVAMNIDSSDARLILLCPAYRKWGTATSVKPGTLVLHSRADDVIPFSESEELVNNSGLPPWALIEVGNDHRLSTPEALAAMLAALLKL